MPLYNPATVKVNLGATTDPLTTSDTASGYAVGSVWLNTSTGVTWRCLDATASAAVWLADKPHPGIVASKFYQVTPGQLNAATAVATLDTVIYLVPFFVENKFTNPTLNVRVLTLGALSAVKMGIWLNDYTTTKRPTGNPVAFNNTGQATTANNSTATISPTYTYYPGVLYWFGAAFTTAGPIMESIASGDPTLTKWLGRTTLGNNTLTGLSAPFTYANNIGTQCDLTSATFTDVAGAAGIPHLHFGT